VQLLAARLGAAASQTARTLSVYKPVLLEARCSRGIIFQRSGIFSPCNPTLKTIAVVVRYGRLIFINRCFS
jgi:hypothetical protein